MSDDLPVPARLGVVMLCHRDLPVAVRLVRKWADSGAPVVIHVDSNTPPEDYEAMRVALSDLPDIRFCARRHCEWGMFSLVSASLDAAQMLLAEFPQVSHALLVSGSCLPLRPLTEIEAYLDRYPGADFIESVNVWDFAWIVDGLSHERFSLHFPFSWRRYRKAFDLWVDIQRRMGVHRRMPQGVVPYLGSQWWCLTRRTLTAILTDPRRPEFDRFFRNVWIPDESYFQSLVRLHALRIESRSMTLSKFDAGGRPYSFHDDHLPLLERSRCFIVRKVWPGAERLLDHFPVPGQDADSPAVAEPDHAAIDRLIGRTVARRARGRPGLYMQSRYPRKDAEKGKTAAPYAVFQGFADIFPDFESWLAERLPGDVHGHLLAENRVEFAGRIAVGPGMLTADPAMRDHDPRGFLANLIRQAPRIQAFQFSPRDRQSLNWFMATDPNAQIRVVTGAWILPLLHADRPFEDIRREVAHLHHVETDQLKFVLQSGWVRARVQIWDLSEFLTDPGNFLSQALAEIAPRAMVHGAMPPIRSISGLGRFLQRLRNAGLKPTLTGAFPVDEDGDVEL